MSDCLWQNGIYLNHEKHINGVLEDAPFSIPLRKVHHGEGLAGNRVQTTQYIGLRMRDPAESDATRAVRALSLALLDSPKLHPSDVLEWWHTHCMPLEAPAACKRTMLSEIARKVLVEYRKVGLRFMGGLSEITALEGVSNLEPWWLARLDKCLEAMQEEPYTRDVYERFHNVVTYPDGISKAPSPPAFSLRGNKKPKTATER